MIRIYFSKLKNGNLEITEKMLTDILSYMKRQDEEIERLNNIINKIKQRVLDETKPLPSAKEIIDIIGVDKE